MKIFISFDCGNDKYFRSFIDAWAKNRDYDFSYREKLSDEIHTKDISKMKVVLANQIDSASLVLVLVSEFSNIIHQDAEIIGYKNWQNWEIAKAKESGKKIVGAKLDPISEPPEEFEQSCTLWSNYFPQSPFAKSYI